MTDRPIKDYRMVLAQTIAPEQTLAEADKAMRENHIRHLPVMDGDKLVGLVSQTDLHLVENLDNVEPDMVRIGSVMSPLPYAVPPETPLGEVVAVMADSRYGSAMVVDDGTLVGIFTATDAVQVLANLLAGGNKKA